jgi:predicted dehydrogenase
LGEWVHSGKLGDVVAVQSTFNFSLTDRSNVRFNPDWGGGCLWDVGVYPISLAQFVFGEAPTKVFGQARWGETGIDEFFCGQLHYPGNRLAQITCSFSTPFYESAVIIGTQGRLVTQRPFVFAVDDFPTHLEFVPNEGEPHTIEIPQEYLYQGEVEDMHAAILESADNYLSLAETRNHVRTALALLESARSGAVASL